MPRWAHVKSDLKITMELQGLKAVDKKEKGKKGDNMILKCKWQDAMI